MRLVSKSSFLYISEKIREGIIHIQDIEIKSCEHSPDCKVVSIRTDEGTGIELHFNEGDYVKLIDFMIANEL